MYGVAKGQRTEQIKDQLVYICISVALEHCKWATLKILKSDQFTFFKYIVIFF